MKTRNLGLLGLAGLAALIGSACGTEPAETEVGTSQDAIIRATSAGGRDQIMQLRIVTYYGQLKFCSAGYFAPRVLLTAAHCLEDAQDVVAYWGNDYLADEAIATESGSFRIPAPGQPSVWAHADSFELHPSWNPELVNPDMGVVYLDRKPPSGLDPLPLKRDRLGDSWLNKEVTIGGWGADSAPTPTTGAGGRVQRTGKTRILGSPTAADYHEDDPHGGMLVPEVRAQIVKTDGNAPYSNPCFGDSGSPMVVNQWGQDYIAGVSSWTGLSCEGYALFTRLDPFLPFLDQAYKKGGQETLIPEFDCVAPKAGGGFTAYFGYNNKNGVGIDVPYGTKNVFARDTSGKRPTHFYPGHYDYVFGVDFTAGQTLSYKLSPDNSPTTTLTVTPTSKACGAEDVVGIGCGGYCGSFARSGCQDLIGYTQCMNECVIFAEWPLECQDLYNEMNACYGATPAGEENWACMEGYPYPQALPCGEQEMAYWDCVYTYW